MLASNAKYISIVVVWNIRYLGINRGSTCQWEKIGDIGEADWNGYDGDVVVQHHCSIRTRVGGVINQIGKLEGTIFCHRQAPIEFKPWIPTEKGARVVYSISH